MSKSFLRVAIFTLTGTAAAFGAVAIGTAAAKLPHREAAQTHAVPLLMAASLAAACLGTAAAGAADLSSRNHKEC
jgi:hypothetical protein